MAERLQDDAPILSLGNLRLNLQSFRATIDGRPVELTVQEMDLLSILLKNPDRIVKYADLTREVWGTESRESNRHLNVLVHRLRTKLVGSSPFQIETVRGRGYGLLAAIGNDEGAGEERQPYPRAGPRTALDVAQ